MWETGFTTLAVCEFPNVLFYFVFVLYHIQSWVKPHWYSKHSTGHKSHFMAFCLSCLCITEKPKLCITVPSKTSYGKEMISCILSLSKK